MGKDGLFSDPKDIIWQWEGKGEKDPESNRVYYRRARVTRRSDNVNRAFHVGDAVYVSSVETEEPWIGHIVEMFQRANHEAGDEVQVVNDTNAVNSMRCTLRWFYMPGDIEQGSFELNPNVKKPQPNEVYFSDHVEAAGSNALEVIEGLAFLCPTKSECKRKRKHPPERFWKDDLIRLVRYFYGRTGNPPPLREVSKRELQFLLENPSTEGHLYHRARSAMFGAHGVVMKGTGVKRAHQLDPPRVRRGQPDILQRHSGGGPSAPKAEPKKEEENMVEIPRRLSRLSTRSRRGGRPIVDNDDEEDEGSSNAGRNPPVESMLQVVQVQASGGPNRPVSTVGDTKKGSSSKEPPTAPIQRRSRMIEESDDEDEGNNEDDPPAVLNAENVRPADNRVVACDVIASGGPSQVKKGNPSTTPKKPDPSQATRQNGNGEQVIASGAVKKTTPRKDSNRARAVSKHVWAASASSYTKALTKLPHEKQQTFVNKQATLVRKMLALMTEQNLSFDMSPEQARLISEQAARATFE